MRRKKCFLILIVLFLLAVTVWMAGKTVETDRWLWTGYRWYPVKSSEVKEEIIYGSVDKEQMNKIADYVCEITGRSYWPPQKEVKTIRSIDKIASIKGFRKFIYEGEPCLYCAYNDENGGKMFVVFEPFLDMKYVSSSYFYINDRLTSEDFSNIKIGSDKEDVLAIDPAADQKAGNLIDGMELETSDRQSVHITEDGYVIIQYDSKGRVTKISENENSMLRMIQEMEF